MACLVRPQRAAAVCVSSQVGVGDGDLTNEVFSFVEGIWKSSDRCNSWIASGGWVDGVIGGGRRGGVSVRV